MGRSTTPTFVVRVTVTTRHGVRHAYSPIAWPTRYAGQPTDATLAAFVSGLEASTQPGGVNEHLGSETVLRASVTRQANGETVASYTT